MKVAGHHRGFRRRFFFCSLSSRTRGGGDRVAGACARCQRPTDHHTHTHTDRDREREREREIMRKIGKGHAGPEIFAMQMVFGRFNCFGEPSLGVGWGGGVWRNGPSAATASSSAVADADAKFSNLHRRAQPSAYRVGPETPDDPAVAFRPSAEASRRRDWMRRRRR